MGRNALKYIPALSLCAWVPTEEAQSNRWSGRKPNFGSLFSVAIKCNSSPTDANYSSAYKKDYNKGPLSFGHPFVFIQDSLPRHEMFSFRMESAGLLCGVPFVR